jgi:predicted regulator of Ras-like GTPase activity (Roadblock/LC7/MglB family)
MKRSDLPQLVEALKPPIQRFVRESRARIALLVSGSGQVLAQHGFTRSYEVMNVASLAAATHASSRALAELSGAGGWQHLYHGGRERQLFLAPLRTPVEELIVVVIFDADSSLGIVRLFYETLERDIAALPAFRAARQGTDQANFERDLEAGLGFMAPEAPSEG